MMLSKFETFGILKIEDVFDDLTNEIIISSLKRHASWQVDTDRTVDAELSDKIDEKYSDTGMLLTSYSKNLPEYIINNNSTLNCYGELIFKKILRKIENRFVFKDVELNRFLWNYYSRSSIGFLHRDNPEKNVMSIVYYLNTCDGYTIVDDKKFNSKTGNAIMFDSNVLHKGVGPKKQKQRFVLNIVFSYSSIERIKEK